MEGFQGFSRPPSGFRSESGTGGGTDFPLQCWKFWGSPDGRSRVEASTWGGGTVEGRWRESRGPGGGKVEVRGPSCGGIVVAGKQRADGIRAHALAWRCGASPSHGAKSGSACDACEAGMGAKEKRAMTAGLPLDLYQAYALPWQCRLLPPTRGLAIPPRWRWRAGRRWCRSPRSAALSSSALSSFCPAARGGGLECGR